MNFKTLLVVWILSLLSIINPFKDNSIINIISIFLLSIFILFMPGYCLVKNIFKENEIDIIEAFALSFVLSISIVPILTFCINLLGVPVNTLTIYCISATIIILSFIIYSMRRNEK